MQGEEVINGTQTQAKRDSSSSEEDRVDTSDELIDYDNNENVDKFIADCASEAK